MIDSERAFWLCSPLPSLTPPRPSQFPRSSCFSSEAENLSSPGPGHRAHGPMIANKHFIEGYVFIRENLTYAYCSYIAGLGSEGK